MWSSAWARSRAMRASTCRAWASRSLFKTVILDGALPRKTFSMGEAREKRFYMEARKIA